MSAKRSDRADDTSTDSGNRRSAVGMRIELAPRRSPDAATPIRACSLAVSSGAGARRRPRVTDTPAPARTRASAERLARHTCPSGPVKNTQWGEWSKKSARPAGTDRFRSTNFRSEGNYSDYQISFFLHNQDTVGVGDLFEASFDGIVLDTETGLLPSLGYNFFSF